MKSEASKRQRFEVTSFTSCQLSEFRVDVLVDVHDGPNVVRQPGQLQAGVKAQLTSSGIHAADVPAVRAGKTPRFRVNS